MDTPGASFSAPSLRLDRIVRERPAHDLAENRTTFGAEHAAFSVYDTIRPAERVPLQANNPLYCGMVTVRQLVGVFVEDGPDKDVLIDLSVKELVVLMLRIEARKLLLEESAHRATA